MNHPINQIPCPDHRTKDHLKAESKLRIRTIVTRVATVRAIDATLLFTTHRESERIASARSLAMAACVAAGVPLCHVARAFSRKWQTVHTAERIASRRYQSSATFRAEWDIITANPDEH